MGWIHTRILIHDQETKTKTDHKCFQL